MVQYRDQLMPLVQMDGVSIATRKARSRSWCSPMTAASMGLVVDEIIDIVEERLNIEVASTHDGILGSAVIKGPGHRSHRRRGISSPWRFADWFSRKEMRPSASAPVGAAGRRLRILPQHAGAGAQGGRLPRAGSPTMRRRAWSCCASGLKFDAILTDIEMPDMNGFEFAEVIKADQRLKPPWPIIALVLDDFSRRDRARPAGRFP